MTEAFEKAAEELAQYNEAKPLEPLTKDLLIGFFANIEDLDKAMAEMRIERKEAFESFCSSHGIVVKPLKDGYKFYRSLRDKKKQAETEEFIRDRIIDALLEEVA